MKRIKSLLSAIMAGIIAMFVVSCNPENKIQSVTGVEITNPSPLKLQVGDTDTLKVNVLPANAANQKFEVLVEDKSIVEVDDKYAIKAMAEGETTITVKTEDGGKEASLKVVVSAAAIRKVSVAEFLKAEAHPNIWYELTGTITKINDADYGNLFIQDGEAAVYVYGVTAEKSENNDGSFPTLGLKEKDVLTIIGTRDYYADAQGEDQKNRVGGPAYYVSHEAFVPGQNFTFSIVDVPDADGLCYATITPSELEQQYVVMDINEYTLHAFADAGPGVEDWMKAYVENIIEEMSAEADGLLTLEEVRAQFLAERGKTGVCEGFTLAPSLGNNYLAAFTYDLEGNISNLKYQMYIEIVPDGDVEVSMALVAAQAENLVISLTFPNNWIKDPYHPEDNHPVLINWGKKQEIGGLSDEDLVARDIERLIAAAAAVESDDDERDKQITLLNQTYQTTWRSKPADDPIHLRDERSLYENDKLEPNTDYVIYSYALQPDYKNGGYFAATKIARLEASTLDFTLVDLNFEFGVDRVQPDADGNLMAYFSVMADDPYQRYTFLAFNENDLASYAKDGVTPKIGEVADEIVKKHIEEYHSAYYTQPLEYWTYLGSGFSRNGIKIDSDASKNKWYILAAALDADLNIGSEVKYQLFDLTGRTSTEAVMNLAVDGADGSYTYSVNPDTTPYVVATVTEKEMEKWFDENYSANEDVLTYIGEQVKIALKSQSVEAYLKANGKTAPVSNEAVNVAEDTYLVAYTLYEKSGTVNGLEYKLLKAPYEEGEIVYLSEGVTFEDGGSWSGYSFEFKWSGGRINFLNNDSEKTSHIILDQVYSSDDDVYTVDLDYTYKGNPNVSYVPENIFAKEATVIVTANADGTYTFTADIFFEDETHIKYIYIGPIPDNLIK